MPPLHEQLSELIRDYRRWKANKTGWCLSSRVCAKSHIKRVLRERGAMCRDDIASASPEFSKAHVIREIHALEAGRVIRRDRAGLFAIREGKDT